MANNIKRCLRFIAAAIAAFLATWPVAASAQQKSPSFAGKQMRMVIASGAGGGYDAYARVLSRHLKDHLAGTPAMIDQNMPGAAGMTAMNWAYSVAPKDGTVILATYNSLLPEPLYGNPAAKFDPLKFEMIGSISKQQNICVTWHTNPVKTIAQAKDHQIVMAATGTAGDSASMPRILNALLGTKLKVITGYETTQSRLAVERGEVDGVCGLSWSTLKASNPDWIAKKRINVLVQTGAKPHPDLPDVPTLLSLVTTPDDKQVVSLLSFPQEMGRPFLMPPGTPKDIVAAVRHAFDETMKDPAFIADAQKSLLEIDPLTGEQMETLLKTSYAAPKPLVKRAAQISGEAR
ncbi:MAG TPA: tripartite tricarboxylate transporter substrate-binding protein [Xanthobacteraceae bacterium]|jgi:tripartite-type tricarboxylate transporter receptor subunit TctC|nr:tripartite tricarboxylate transporter substrate-binding protein [Xanthobacteraceae bacterium]